MEQACAVFEQGQAFLVYVRMNIMRTLCADCRSLFCFGFLC